MSIKEQLLATLIEHGIFDNEESKVSGIAKLAINKGYDSLSEQQKKVIQPFMTHKCEGFTDPGGYHNNCSTILESDQLLSAYKNNCGIEGILCESCISEIGYINHRYEKIMRE